MLQSSQFIVGFFSALVKMDLRGAKMAGWPFLTRVFDLFCLVHFRRVQQLNHLSISKGSATNFRIHVPHNESEREGCGSLWDSILHSWECDVDKNEVSDTTDPEKKHQVFVVWGSQIDGWKSSSSRLRNTISLNSQSAWCRGSFSY